VAIHASRQIEQKKSLAWRSSLQYYRDDQFDLSDAELSMSITMPLAFLRGDWQGA